MQPLRRGKAVVERKSCKHKPDKGRKTQIQKQRHKEPETQNRKTQRATIFGSKSLSSSHSWSNYASSLQLPRYISYIFMIYLFSRYPEWLGVCTFLTGNSNQYLRQTCSWKVLINELLKLSAVILMKSQGWKLSAKVYDRRRVSGLQHKAKNICNSWKHF